MLEDHARRGLFLERLCSMPVTEEIVDIMVSIVTSVIPCAPSPANSPLPSLTRFVRQMCERSRASAGSVFACITYIERLRSKLPQTAKGMHCTAHRIFLSALVCANKYCNDTPLRNKQWSRLTSFSLQEVNLMERQLLFLLNFELAISFDALLAICARYYHPSEVLSTHKHSYKPMVTPAKHHGDLPPAISISRPKEPSVETLVGSPASATPSALSKIPFVESPTEASDSEMELEGQIREAGAAIRHNVRAIASVGQQHSGNGLPPLPAANGSRIPAPTPSKPARPMPSSLASQATLTSFDADTGACSTIGVGVYPELPSKHALSDADSYSQPEKQRNIFTYHATNRSLSSGRYLNASVDSIDLIEVGGSPAANNSDESAPAPAPSKLRRAIWSVLRP